MLLSRQALEEVLSTLSLFGAARLNARYGPAWICSHCGGYEPAPASSDSSPPGLTGNTPSR